MADGFEPYHVPQQSRRDKLRVTAQSGGADGLQVCATLVPLYDPSLDLINCANLRPPGFSLGGSVAGGVKEEAMNLMNFGGGMNSSSHMYVDPQLSVQLNPSPVPEISGVYPPPPHWPEAAAALSMAHHQDCHDGGTGTGAAQSLSLSLSSHPSSNLPLELNLERYNNDFSSNSNNNTTSSNKGSGGYDFVASNGVEFCKSSVPLGPFTGYASVLKGSRFLKPAQQLLEELCGVGRRGERTVVEDTSSPPLMDPPPLDDLTDNGIVEDSINCTSEGSDQTRKKSRLLSMIDEVIKRYRQYYQQMQATIAAFESVAGLSSAAPFANLALKAMSKNFTCLKNAVTDQLRFITKSHGKTNCDRDEALRLEQSGRGSYNQRPFHGAGFNDQPVWRPQRGLPERAVTVLRAWLFEHFLHPYPTDTDKIMLAKQTGLSRNQVSNWFINARVRLWKPMVEEIHMLEMRENQKAASLLAEQPPKRLSTDHFPTSCSIHQHHRIGEFPLKDAHDSSATDHEAPHMKLPYDNLLHYAPGTAAGSVSLTLGLHQNGVGLPDSYAMNAARRFGLETTDAEGYMMAGFEFGRDHVGGQLTHDFVG